MLLNEELARLRRQDLQRTAEQARQARLVRAVRLARRADRAVLRARLALAAV